MINCHIFINFESDFKMQKEMKKIFSMKKLIITSLILFIVLFSLPLKAQEGEEVVIKYPEQYLFPDFTVGKVAMKTGKDIFLILNYSMVLEKMMFLQRGQVYEMLNYDNVDTIYLQDKKFIPYNKIFLEVALEDKIPLFVRHVGRVLGPSKPAAYGGKSEVSSSSYISFLSTTGEPFRMKNLEELNLKHDYFYWISINGEMKSFITKKQFLQYFPDKKSIIRQYMRQNSIKFDRPEDVKKLVEFCNTI